MKILWPPSEENGWSIQSYQQKSRKQETTRNQETKTTFFFPLQNLHSVLLALRVNSESGKVSVEIPVAGRKGFSVDISGNQWTMIPYPIEQHAIGPIWSELHFSGQVESIELGYVNWNSRTFRMRGLLTEDGDIFLAYRYNKNGQVVAYLPPFDTLWTLPEDTYMIPLTRQINEKSIVLVPARSDVRVKKTAENRYFPI